MINGEDVIPDHDNKYVRIMLDYVQARKTDYLNNIPKVDVTN